MNRLKYILLFSLQLVLIDLFSQSELMYDFESSYRLDSSRCQLIIEKQYFDDEHLLKEFHRYYNESGLNKRTIIPFINNSGIIIFYKHDQNSHLIEMNAYESKSIFDTIRELPDSSLIWHVDYSYTSDGNILKANFTDSEFKIGTDFSYDENGRKSKELEKVVFHSGSDSSLRIREYSYQLDTIKITNKGICTTYQKIYWEGTKKINALLNEKGETFSVMISEFDEFKKIKRIKYEGDSRISIYCLVDPEEGQISEMNFIYDDKGLLKQISTINDKGVLTLKQEFEYITAANTR